MALAPSPSTLAAKATALLKPAAPKKPVSLSLAQQAARLGGQQVAAQVAAIEAQQHLAIQQAQDRAHQISLASLAGAHMLSGLGTPTYNSYKDAATTIAGLTGGFSGQLQDDAHTQAAQVAHDLAAAGAPGGAVDHSGELANVLYGERGLQPASTLLNSGAAAAARENAVPQGIIGYGQDLALGTLGTGRDEAAKYEPQIAAAEGNRPAVVANLLAQLSTAKSNTEKLAISEALAQSLIQSRTDSTTLGAAKVKIAAQNANTSAGRASAAAEAAAVRNQIGQFNADTARYKALNPTSALPKAATPTQKAGWLKMADNFYHGVAAKTRVVNGALVPIPGTGSAPVTYPKAFAALRAVGATRAEALQVLNTLYQPGEGGRPKVTTRAQRAAAARVRQSNARARKGKDATGLGIQVVPG